MNYRISLKTLGKSPDDIAKEHKGKPKSEVDGIIVRTLETDPYIDYADLIEVVVRNPPTSGFDEGEMRKAVAILDALAEVKKVKRSRVLLLNADLWTWLVGRLAAFRWRIIHRNLIQFCDDIKSAEKVDG